MISVNKYEGLLYYLLDAKTWELKPQKKELDGQYDVNNGFPRIEVEAMMPRSKNKSGRHLFFILGITIRDLIKVRSPRWVEESRAQVHRLRLAQLRQRCGRKHCGDLRLPKRIKDVVSMSGMSMFCDALAPWMHW